MEKVKPFNMDEFKLGQNLFVEASAGTGKTFTIRKIVAKLVKEGVPLSKILLVTYTEKAAGELRDRIRQEMEECGLPGDVDSATIGTIHSFCKKTLHDFAVESKVPFDMKMTDDSAIENKVDALIRDVWEEELNQVDFSLDEIRTALIDSVKKYDGTQTLRDQFATDLKEYRRLNPKFDLNLKILQDHAGESFTIQRERSGVVTEAQKAVSEMLEKVEANLEANVKWSGINAGSPFGKRTVAADSPEVVEATNYFRNPEINLMDADKAAKFRFVLKKLKEVHEEYQADKLSNKQQSFNDMILLVQKAVLEKNSTLCRKLREMYRYAIIDEFQDTNQAQWDIFKTVFLNSGSNNLIVVGDPKQSIYSFQNADLNVYFNAIHSPGFEGRSLGVNYRSTNAMIHACNEMFKAPFFGDSEKAIPFNASLAPSESSASNPEIPSPTFDGQVLKPVSIVQGSAEEFARYAAQKIAEFCEKDSNGKTRLQVFHKEDQTFRNVKFSDIAILGRSRTELAEMESVLALSGIPFARYKDANLFKGRECQQWLALFRAVDAPDFSGRNRAILNTALVSDFFRISFVDLETKKWEDPRNPILLLFAKWRTLVKKFRWAELQESIYGETQIDKFLCESSKLQSFAKVKQIGMYAFDYLYNNRVSLDELIRHLEGLTSNSEDADEDDGNLVSKGSDLDAVQLMTIHASKGLQFPVVISLAGNKGKYAQAPGPFVYTDAEKRRIFGLDDESKKTRQAEELEEWRRLLYVDYTRAEALLIAPLYSHWFDDNGNLKGDFVFLAQAEMSLPEEWKESVDATDLEWNRNALKSRVDAILQTADSETKTFAKVPEEGEEEHRQRILALDQSLGEKSIFPYSYSSLSGHGDTDDVTKDGSRENQEDGDTDDVKPLKIDLDPVRVLPFAPTETVPALETVEGFPKGRLLGNAMHAVFEKMDFERSDNWVSEDAVLNDSAFRALIAEQFQDQGYEIQSKPEWISQMAKFIYHTMNATLPEIHGSRSMGKNFALKELPKKDRLAEMEFHLKANDPDMDLHQFCKGFMDVLFVRGDYFSILDWKSDVIPNYGVMNAEGDGTQTTVDKRYAVQRVLYSYCLIQWLKSFGTFGDSEEEIFENHFGGVYYVFARGCRSGESSGLYAQTWKNYEDLKKEYLVLKKMMRA